jgi:hypothetical protein
MSAQKALVYIREDDESKQRRVAGMVTSLLATYKSYVLVQATDDQIAVLEAAGFRVEVQADATQIQLGVFTFDTGDLPQVPKVPRTAPKVTAAFEAVIPPPDVEEQPYCLVQFIGPIKDEWKTGVTNMGGELLDYVPHNTFVARLPADTRAQVAALPFVEWVGPYLPEYKVGSRMTTTGRRTLTGRDTLTIDVDPAVFPYDPEGNLEIILHEPGGMATAVKAIEALGGQIIDQGGRSLLVAIDPHQIEAIVRVPEVCRIARHVPPMPDNNVAADLTNVRAVRDPASPMGLRGRNQIVAVADTGLDSSHQDFSGRVVNSYSWGRPASSAAPGGSGATDDPDGHGTHVSGSILGDGGASGGQFQGMAPEASLIIQSTFRDKGGQCGTPPNVRRNLTRLRIPADLTPLFQQAYSDGARVHNNSWGARVDGEYTDKSANVDAFVWTRKDMVILFSAGNAGDDLDRNGIIDSDSIGAPATAKNCITVGASESLRTGSNEGNQRPWGTRTYCPPSTRTSPDGDEHRYPRPPLRDDLISDNPHGIAAFSSRGPTNDGRTKPDIVAPGTNTLSARSQTSSRTGASQNSNYYFSSGTSMACPITAGAAVLIRQFLIERKSHQPSAALVKAMLINGATPLHGQYHPQEIGTIPNNDIGWGVINLCETLIPTQPRRVWFHDEWQDPSQSLRTGEDVSFTIMVTDRTEALKVTLVWSDAPSTADPSPPPVPSPLKLVNDLDLTVFDPSGIPHRGNRAPGPGGDRLNNVEGVIIELPELGQYQIQIEGYNVPQGPQDYALVVSGAFQVVAPPAVPPGGPVVV